MCWFNTTTMWFECFLKNCTLRWHPQETAKKKFSKTGSWRLRKYDLYLEDFLFQSPDLECELVKQLNRCHIRSQYDCSDTSGLLRFHQRLCGVRFIPVDREAGQNGWMDRSGLCCFKLSRAAEVSCLNGYVVFSPLSGGGTFWCSRNNQVQRRWSTETKTDHFNIVRY